MTVTQLRPTPTKLAGRCNGSPRYVPAHQTTPADDTARQTAGWTRPGHKYAGTTGKAGAYVVAVPCHYTATDGADFGAHLKAAHKTVRHSSGPLTGRGFRAPAATVLEKLTLGRTVVVTLPGGLEVTGQVWGDADPSALGSRRESCVFVVADGRSYVFPVTQKDPGAPWHGRALDNRTASPGQNVTGQLVAGPVGEQTTLEETPADTVPATDDATPARFCCKTCGAETTPGIGYAVTDATTVLPDTDPACSGDHLHPAPVDVDTTDAPATVPAPMPRQERDARRASNRELAAAMRARGILPTGPAWQLARAGADLDTLAGVLATIPAGGTR